MSSNGPFNPYTAQPGTVQTVAENTERQEIVVVKPNGATIVISGAEERMLVDLVTGGRRLERAQLLYLTDDGRLILNPGQEGGEVYLCGICNKLCSAASIRFCFKDQVPLCLSCGKKEEENGRNLYFCPSPCHGKYRWRRFFSWLFSLGNK